MTHADILATVDHTLLAPTATAEQIRALCDEGLRYRTASVCVPPNAVATARDALRGELPICTVVGFPNGYATTAAKVFETRDALENGADEIDTVIPLGWVKEQRYEAVLRELRALRRACEGHVLKVIVETCLLTESEKIALCRVVSESGADFIKTSTGFSTGGATPDDVALLAANLAPGVKVKAAGGIRSWADAEAMLASGASRLGTSRLVRLAEQERPSLL